MHAPWSYNFSAVYCLKMIECYQKTFHFQVNRKQLEEKHYLRWWNDEPKTSIPPYKTLTNTNMILSIGFSPDTISYGYGLQMAASDSLFFPLCQRSNRRNLFLEWNFALKRWTRIFHFFHLSIFHLSFLYFVTAT